MVFFYGIDKSKIVSVKLQLDDDIYCCESIQNWNDKLNMCTIFFVPNDTTILTNIQKSLQYVFGDFMKFSPKLNVDNLFLNQTVNFSKTNKSTLIFETTEEHCNISIGSLSYNIFKVDNYSENCDVFSN